MRSQIPEEQDNIFEPNQLNGNNQNLNNENNEDQGDNDDQNNNQNEENQNNNNQINENEYNSNSQNESDSENENEIDNYDQTHMSQDKQRFDINLNKLIENINWSIKAERVKKILQDDKNKIRINMPKEL